MCKPIAAILFAIFVASANCTVLAQDAGYQNSGYQNANYQSTSPSWPQQAPQGYEQPQYDAYRGEAQMQSSASGTRYGQPIQPGSGSDSVSRAVMEAQQTSTHAADKPIKAEKFGGKKLKGAVGGIGRTVGRMAVTMGATVAGLGAMYMVTKAATRAGMMGGYGGMGMGGYGMPMGGMPMGYGGMRGYGW